MIGIVLVSHSPALARSAFDLAVQMVPGERPRVAIAAGAGEGVLGTDAVKVSEAIAEVASPDGVLVLMDLGSAVLSAEMALEFVSTGDMPIRLTSAPFVEGLLAGLVRAASGASLDDVADEASRALVAKSSQLGDGPDSEGATGGAAAGETTAPSSRPDSGELTASLTLTNPDGLHARPASLLVAALGGLDAVVGVRNERTGAVVPDASSMTSLLTLGARKGDSLQLGAIGPDAQRAIDAFQALVADGFGENEPQTEQARPVATATTIATATEAPVSRSFTGGPIGVSPGRAVGAVAKMPPDAVTAPESRAPLAESERDAEAARIPPAAEAVRIILKARSERASQGRAGGDAQSILEATALLAADHVFADAAQTRVRDRGETAERAIWVSMSAIADQLAAQGGRMAERVADLHDVRDRIIAELRGEPAPGVPDPGHPFILIARDLAPADTALLDPDRTVGLITAEGGPTSHTAILARSLGIPAIVAAPDALSIPEGTTVMLDGTTGEIIIDPSPELAASATAEPRAASFGGSGQTSDGRRIEILANVASAESVAEAVSASAEGVGLFRTEFSFLDRETAPTIVEQTEAYRAVLAAFPGRKVIVRTLDAGADKPLPFLTDAAETNPALGVRGYRTSWRHPEVLDQQLAAIAESARAERAEVWVMAPMISTVAEARDFVDRCNAHGLHRVGVMIETPAAALTAAEILTVVDFVSLGTNDLAQYTMAADRLIGELAPLNDAWQPAVLRLIRLVGDAGKAAGKPVGVCGEAGADASLAPVLAGLGVTSLSMTPRAIDTVADRLAHVTWDQCLQAAALAVSAEDATGARRAVGDLLSR